MTQDNDNVSFPENRLKKRAQERCTYFAYNKWSKMMQTEVLLPNPGLANLMCPRQSLTRLTDTEYVSIKL